MRLFVSWKLMPSSVFRLLVGGLIVEWSITNL
jgi:hypothetical protein